MDLDASTLATETLRSALEPFYPVMILFEKKLGSIRAERNMLR